MSTAKRQCPVCGSENSEADFFCQNCGSDISLAGREPARPVSEPEPPLAVESAVPESRVCPQCGQANDAVFLLCTTCGFDLSSVEFGKMPAARLFVLAGQETWECKDGDILGREGTAARAFFSAIGTVSRRHVRLTQRDGRWFISVMPGVQNITQLDGGDLAPNREQPLSGEHVLQLSTQCIVRLRVVAD